MFKICGEIVPISIPEDLPHIPGLRVPVESHQTSEQVIVNQTSDKVSEKAVYRPPAIAGSRPVAPTKKSKPYPTPFDEMVSTDNNDDVKMKMSDKESLNKTIDEKNTKKGNKRHKQWRVWKADTSNASVRRMVPPKSPWTLLEELSRSLDLEIIHSFLEPVDEDGLKLFPCEVIVNGDPYVGSAPDADISKNIAAEMAIQAYVMHVVSNRTGEPEVTDPLDNAPWAALASLGLFKLFNDWQSRGFSLPMMAQPAPPPVSNNPSTPSPCKKRKEDKPGFQPDFVMKPCKKLPSNPTSVHPVQLFNECYPQAEFAVTLGGVNTPYTVTVTVDGQQFTGEGRNKKDAKKMCAIAAAKGLLNIDY